MADVLDYEPKQSATGSPWCVLVNLLLVVLAAWPFIQSQIFSPHGMSDNDMRFGKLELAVGFAASYVLTRRRSDGVRVLGWLLFVPHALIAATFAWAVVGVAIGRE